MKQFCSKLLVCGAAVAGWLVPFTAHAQGRKIDFNRDIRPLLSNTCYKCHGPDEKERKAGLRLDTQEGAGQKLESGALTIVPGMSGESELYARISSTDPNEQMPPPNSGKTLSAQQIELIKRWIDEGATMRGHWSLVAPVRPQPPAVKNEAAVRNSIDRFVVARLEQEGVAPSAEADRTTLIRRVTYDLTGLPPTPAEIDAFLADTANDAYDRLVERLLTNSRYGEQMARYWLDAARYGDSHGLHFDNERSIWLYREWVIKAFNRNLPFDRFTIEQLAGDLLPEATIDQKIASGFNRCNVTTSEGGSIDDEVLVRYTVDRVETTSTVFMGLTLGCSVCHDHKYDPFTQREFYQLYAFFNSLAGRQVQQFHRLADEV
jgi:mono/diheme cytochrome c family protein